MNKLLREPISNVSSPRIVSGIARWRRKFMPISATEAALKGPLAATDHSLKKWQGYAPAMLAHYELSIGDVIATGCALCAFNDLAAPPEALRPVDCTRCPLHATLGHPCDETDGTPYAIWRTTGDTTPMVDALAETKAALRDGTLVADADGVWTRRTR